VPSTALKHLTLPSSDATAMVSDARSNDALFAGK
jgi:hypothetical protein